MNFLNSLSFWTKFWAVFVAGTLLILALADVTAVIRGHHDKVGDEFTLTHFLVSHVGLSVLGAGIGYLVAHFLIVHRSG